MKQPLKERPWYPYAVAACIAVVLYVVLANLNSVWNGITTFLGFFGTVFLACVIAYCVNPLARWLRNFPLRKIAHPRLKRVISNVLAIVIVLAFVIFLLVILVPQLVESISLFLANYDGYIASLNTLLQSFGLSTSSLGIDKFASSSETLLNTISDYLKNNITDVVAVGTDVGSVLLKWIIALLLSCYLLAEKDGLNAGLNRLTRAIVGPAHYPGAHSFLLKCDAIFNRYIVYNIIDSIIIGTANALFMTIAGMEYVGLVSFVVAVTNIVPTFGPIIGAVIGAFILLMVNPWHALIFIAFTILLQTCDAYVIKPRLFGSSLGVSGLWILVGVLVGGAMFGIVGILLAIPGVAIIDLVYKAYFLPWLERKRGITPEQALPEANAAQPEDASASTAEEPDQRGNGSADTEAPATDDTTGKPAETALDDNAEMSADAETTHVPRA